MPRLPPPGTWRLLLSPAPNWYRPAATPLPSTPPLDSSMAARFFLALSRSFMVGISSASRMLASSLASINKLEMERAVRAVISASVSRLYFSPFRSCRRLLKQQQKAGQQASAQSDAV